ncbi:MAG: hypothetical protein KatS3mg061_3486 [Dehalococcoidia bacterium]|nr:MAG: hypothetical protein KatS3mg061_3486 [Dehalococcoidia bacterium]
MNVLITGLTGLVGSHLAEYLLTIPGVNVYGLKRWRSDAAPIRHLSGRITIIEGDVEDRSSVERAIALSQPDRIFHLAAQSYPSESWDAPVLTMAANVVGTLNLLETGAPPLAPGGSPYRRFQRRVWRHPPGGLPHPGDDAAAAAEPLRGEQGGTGAAGLPVLRELWHPDLHHPLVQPYRAVPGGSGRLSRPFASKWPRSRWGSGRQSCSLAT